MKGAAWVQLHFDKWSLGDHGTLVIRSLADGAEQRFSQRTLNEWNGYTAFFNGDAVEVELYRLASREAVSVQLAEVIIDAPEEPTSDVTTCGNTDDRQVTTNDAVGRFFPTYSNRGCTAWATATGSYLTAGHCLAGGYFTHVQFRVPASSSSGMQNHPPPQYQFPFTTFRSQNSAGNDWAVIRLGNNSDGKPPHAVLGPDYFSISDLANPSDIRITGHGFDTGTSNQRLQTHVGPSQGENVYSSTNAVWRYRTDTQGGNSGSPVIYDQTSITVGIHTNGGCTSSGGSNSGTSFENVLLEDAIEDETGASVYVDAGGINVSYFLTGGALRPYTSLQTGLNNTPSGGTLLVAAGSYPGTYSITSPVRIRPAAGAVRIGPGASSLAKASPVAVAINEGLSSSDLEEGGEAKMAGRALPTKAELSMTGPNPFSSVSEVEFGLPTDTEAQIRVVDTIGREVATLHGQPTAAGWHTISLNARDWASGLYIVILETPAGRQTETVTVLR